MTEMMVGRDINPSSTPALSRLRPDGTWKTREMSGASTTRPKNPMTTEGNPAKSSTIVLAVTRTQPLSRSEMTMAPAMPAGMAMRRAMRVVRKEPASSGMRP